VSEFRARIGRIRMKNGGADVRVIDRKIDSGDGQDWRGSIQANARKIAEMGTEADPLVGYVVLGIFAEGGASMGYRYDFDRAPIPRMLLPAWIAELIRRDMLVNPEARDVFNEMFEWVGK
jgi:hypothetical protein